MPFRHSAGFNFTLFPSTDLIIDVDRDTSSNVNHWLSSVFLDTNFLLTAYETYFKGKTKTKKQNNQKNDPTSIPSVFLSNQEFFCPILIQFCDNPTPFALLSILATIKQQQPPTISNFLQITFKEIN